MCRINYRGAYHNRTNHIKQPGDGGRNDRITRFRLDARPGRTHLGCLK